MKRLCFLLGLFFLSAGCASKSHLNDLVQIEADNPIWQAWAEHRMPIETWELEGNFSAKKGLISVASLDFLWYEARDNLDCSQNISTNVYYFNEFGIQVVHIFYEKIKGLLLRVGLNDVYKDENAQNALSKLGITVPIEYMRYWVKGMPVPSSDYEVWFDPEGKLRKMKQEGVEVEYIRFNEDGLPTYYVMRNDQNNVVLSMRLHTWFFGNNDQEFDDFS